jgi:hypothetical protein
VATETELYAPAESDSWEYGIEPKQVIWFPINIL